jgi:methylmalonyl-CoA mutase N-terminal domain/subunit
LAGSYFIEFLTDQIEKHARGYLEKIDALGGMLKAIDRGFVQQEIQNAAYEYQRSVDTGEATVVGVNRFTQESEHEVPIQRIDESLERKQVERIQALRARRDAATWKQAIDAIRTAARTGDSLMPHIVTAVDAYATVGEISDAMRGIFGEYHETVVI